MSWKKIPINKVFNFEKGILQSSKNTQGEYDFITASSEWKTHSTYSHECEALVFAMAASGSLGRTHYVDGKFIASDLCFIITPKDEYKDKVNLKFYYRYFNAIREILVKALATGSAKLSINAGNFGKYEIIIGEIEEQNKLIEKLDFIISKRTEISEYIERNIQLSKNLKSSILQDAIQGKLVSQDPSAEPASILLEKIQAEKSKLIATGKLKKQKSLAPIKPDEIPYELPNGWEWVRLGDVGILKRGKSKHRPRNDYRLFDGGIYPFIQTGDVSNARRTNGVITTINGHYNEFGLNQSELHKEGTLCVTIAANIAECGFLGFDSCLPDSIVCFDLINEELKRYTYFFIQNSKKYLEDFAPQTAQKNINLEILQNLPFPLPSLRELKDIVSKVDELMKSCELLDEQIKQAKERSEKLMESVLQGVFNG